MVNVQFLRYRRWSILQTLTLTVLGCYRSPVSGEIGQGCVGSQLSLRCPEMKVIEILAVVLGDSNCLGASCCIKDSDCTRHANENHRSAVKGTCNGQVSCTVDVFVEEITCGYFFDKWSNNDFERITYECKDDARVRPTTTSTTGGSDGGWDTRNETYINETANVDAWNTTTSVKDDQNNEIDNAKDEHTNVEDTAEWRLKLVSLVMVINGIVIVFIVIVLVIVKLRRNRCFRGRHSGQLCYIEIEAIAGASENQENHYSRSPSLASIIPGNTSPGIREAEGQMARSCENECYEAANDVVSSKLIKNCEGFTSNKDLHCDQKPVYTSPKLRARAHSPTLDIEESELTAFTVLDNNIYCEVETMEPEKESSSKRTTSEEALKQGEHNDVRRITKTQSPMLRQKPIPLEITSSALKKDLPAKVEPNESVHSLKRIHGPIYESLTPRTPEGKLFIWPLTTRTISRENSETEHPYCDMKWPPPKFEPNGESDASARSNSSIDDNNTYCDVDTWESAETGSSKGNNIEANQKKGKSNDMSTKSPMTNVTQKPGLETYNTFNTDCEQNLDIPEKCQVSPNDVAQLTKMSEDLSDSYDIEPSYVWFTNGEGDTMIDNDIYNH